MVLRGSTAAFRSSYYLTYSRVGLGFTAGSVFNCIYGVFLLVVTITDLSLSIKTVSSN